MTTIVPMPIYVHRRPTPRRRPDEPERTVPRPWLSTIALWFGRIALVGAAIGFFGMFVGGFLASIANEALRFAPSWTDNEMMDFSFLGLPVAAAGGVLAGIAYGIAHAMDVDPFPDGKVETWGVYRTDNGQLVHTFEHNSGEPVQLLYEAALREIGYKVEMPGTGSADEGE